MTRLAEFVQSPAGRLYARTCAHYGADPAAMFSDPLVAINARVGFAVMEMDAADDTPRTTGNDTLDAAAIYARAERGR